MFHLPGCTLGENYTENGVPGFKPATTTQNVGIGQQLHLCATHLLLFTIFRLSNTSHTLPLLPLQEHSVSTIVHLVFSCNDRSWRSVCIRTQTTPSFPNT